MLRKRTWWRTGLLATTLLGSGAMTLWACGPYYNLKQKPAAEVFVAAPAEQAVAKPKIQIVVLLDTSSSMDGLINQARTQLWKMVNELGKAKCRQQQPDLEVSLFEYGNDSLPASEGYIRQIVPFTTDLDKISKELFTLRTNGGSEFCGQVIQQAVKTLNWSEQAGDLKCIFIAGNEPFTQGPVDYKDACKAAANKGITISTIHCGDLQTGLRTGWADGAKLADGNFMSINADEKFVEIATPYDAKITELSTKLNGTYVPYGSAQDRKAAVENQVAQDNNAISSGGLQSNATRAATKISGNYKNSHWDLCDAITEKKVDWKDLKDEQLPEEMRKLDAAGRQKFIDAKLAERKAIQDEIKQNSSDRQAFIDKARAEQKDKPAENSLEAAIVKTAREQAAKKNFTFDK
jgi:hypothetical protein